MCNRVWREAVQQGVRGAVGLGYLRRRVEHFALHRHPPHPRAPTVDSSSRPAETAKSDLPNSTQHSAAVVGSVPTHSSAAVGDQCKAHLG